MKWDGYLYYSQPHRESIKWCFLVCLGKRSFHTYTSNAFLTYFLSSVLVYIFGVIRRTHLQECNCFSTPMNQTIHVIIWGRIKRHIYFGKHIFLVQIRNEIVFPMPGHCKTLMNKFIVWIQGGIVYYFCFCSNRWGYPSLSSLPPHMLILSSLFLISSFFHWAWNR